MEPILPPIAMEPIVLTVDEVVEFMAGNWHLYASDCSGVKPKRLYYNGAGKLRILVGCDEVWIGTDVKKAVEKFNKL